MGLVAPSFSMLLVSAVPKEPVSLKLAFNRREYLSQSVVGTIRHTVEMVHLESQAR